MISYEARWVGTRVKVELVAESRTEKQSGHNRSKMGVPTLPGLRERVHLRHVL
jgi:hypothetical protein